MSRAVLTALWLIVITTTSLVSKSYAASDIAEGGSVLPKSPMPDKNGLPAPLNLKDDFGGVIPAATTSGGNRESFSARDLLPVHQATSTPQTSDIHLYLDDKAGKAGSLPPSLDAIEGNCFSRTFAKDTAEQRLSRLEQFVFGKTSTTGDVQVRLEKIAKVVSPPRSDAAATSDADGSPVVGATATPPQQKTPSLISVINDGIDQYNVHDYQRAEDNFEKCCAMAPDMARVHSYLAITKLQLNQRQAALEEFRTTYAIDPFGTYGRYAKVCLLKLAGDEEIRKRGPVDSNEILQSSLSKINSQSDDLMNFHNRESNRSKPVPANTNSFFAAQMQSTSARNNVVLQNALTQESANNLKHLMGLKKKVGDAHLRAWGTSLSTRYYGEDTYLYAPYYIPREYPVELKALQKTLAAKPSGPQTSVRPARSKSAHRTRKG